MDGARVLHQKTDFIIKSLILFTAAFLWIWAGSARADIYSWTDAHGILHFTNYAPPAEAEFHMVEYFAEPAPDATRESLQPSPPTDPIRAQLEEANRKLEATLDKVDDLTQKVEQTRREADAAAEAAQRAAAEAQAAMEAKPEETVVYSLPYRPRHHPLPPRPYYWQLDTNRYPYYHGGHDHPHDKGDKLRPHGPAGAGHSGNTGTTRPIAAPVGGMDRRK